METETLGLEKQVSGELDSVKAGGRSRGQAQGLSPLTD